MEMLSHSSPRQNNRFRFSFSISSMNITASYYRAQKSKYDLHYLPQFVHSRKWNNGIHAEKEKYIYKE